MITHAKKDQVRRSVERLLAGERNVNDLHRMMLWLRTRSFGHQLVKEIGDAIAHFDERRQGIFYDRVRDLFWALDFLARRFQPPLHPDIVPVDKTALERAVRATMNRTDPMTVLKQLGFGLRRAKAAACAAIDKLDDQCGGEENLTREESRALAFFADHFVIPSPITQDEITKELESCLEKLDLISTDERSAVNDIGSYLCAYLITVMHRAELPISEGHVGRLYARLTTAEEGEHLSVSGGVPIVPNGNTFQSIGHELFSTSCSGRDWCSKEILELPRTGGPWAVEIEMDGNGVIQLIHPSGASLVESQLLELPYEEVEDLHATLEERTQR